MTKGMIIDGVAASEAIDSSGEILDIEGCDISDLEEGRGVLNYEHKSEGEKDSSFGDKLGRIVFAKKIFTAKDCSNDRETFYWEQVKLPLIYIQCELFDQDGHLGASEAAATIRHYAKRQLPILVRYSIEGAVLKRDSSGKRLLKCIAKQVAATIKPCNKSCLSGVLYDPADGKEKKQVAKDPIQEFVETKKFEHPSMMKLGYGPILECNPEIEVSADLRKTLEWVRNVKALSKTLTAGSYNAAPGALTGGAALQREDISHRAMKNQAMAALRDWDRTGDLKKFLKSKLPDADPDFIDHFAGLVDEVRMRNLKKGEPQNPPFAPPPENVRPPNPSFASLAKPEDRSAVVRPSHKGGLQVTKNAVLHTGKGSFKMHFPDIGSKSPYFHILYPKAAGLTDEQRDLYHRTVHQPFERMMKHWMVLNDGLREGRLPESVVYHAGMFSAMSPSTPVPLQELYYGHTIDMMHDHGFDPREPVHEHHIDYLKRMINGYRLPEWNRDHYEATTNATDGAREDTPATPDGQDPPQVIGFENYNAFHPHLMSLVGVHRDDGQSIVGTLMDMKAAHLRANKARSAGRPANTPAHPSVRGFGPKLARHMATMFGAGNLHVPDRHNIRSLFGLHLEKDKDKIAHLSDVFQDSRNEKHLRAIDQHLLDHHPAVQHVVSKYPEHFQGREHQALFPATFLHWLATPHYERAQGKPTSAQNEGTDHKVFWDSIASDIQAILHKYNVHAPDDSFEFGANVTKAEPETIKAPMAVRTAHAQKEIEERYGEHAGNFAFHAYLLPALMADNARYHQPGAYRMLMKMQSLDIELRKAKADPGPRNTYKVYSTATGDERMLARFSIVNDELKVLEDHDNVMAPFGEDGQKALHTLREDPKYKLVSMADENAEAHDKDKEAAMPEPVQAPSNAPSFFEYRIRGDAMRHTVEVKGRTVKLDGKKLDEEEADELMQKVRQGHASLRIKPTPAIYTQIAKMEDVFAGIVKLDELHKQESKRDNDQELKEYLTRDTSVPELGNFFAWREFKAKAEPGIYIELDGNDITSVNKVHGFEVGDAALKKMGECIFAASQETNSKARAFREGADTFMVFLPHFDNVVQFCHKARQAFEQIPSIGGTHNLSACFGIGETPDQAHKALLKAKEAKYEAMGRSLRTGQSKCYTYYEIPGREGLIPEDTEKPLKKTEGDDNPLPPAPGTAPLKPGHVRLYHQTDAANLDSIRQNGITLAHAKGHEGPKAIYASKTPFYGSADSIHTVEFQVPEHEFQPPFVTGSRHAKVDPSDFLAVHEPWHGHARYMEEDPEVLQNVLSGKNDYLLDEKDYGTAIRYLKKKYAKK